MTDNRRSYSEVNSVVKAEGASLDDPRVHQAMEESAAAPPPQVAGRGTRKSWMAPGEFRLTGRQAGEIMLGRAGRHLSLN